jgi:hypothetical protein
MSSGFIKRAFALAARMRRQSQDMPDSSHSEPELRLPRLRSCEIAAAAGLDAVRRALEEMPGEGNLPT